jgi:hypothetical protein
MRAQPTPIPPYPPDGLRPIGREQGSLGYRRWGRNRTILRRTTVAECGISPDSRTRPYGAIYLSTYDYTMLPIGRNVGYAYEYL